MKAVFVPFITLLFFCVVPSSAQHLLSGDFPEQPIKKILSELDRNLDFDLIYRDSWIPDSVVTVRFEGTPVETALIILLKNTNLSFTRYSSYAYIIAPQYLLSALQEMSGGQPDLSRLQRDLTFERKKETIFIGDAGKVSKEGLAVISGKVTNAVTEEGVISAGISFDSTRIFAQTNTKGFFTKELPAGVYNAKISAVGYETSELTVRVTGGGTWDILLQPESYKLDEVVVTAESDKDAVRNAQIGVMGLSPLEIRDLPKFLGSNDVIKAIMTLPGVSGIGEGSTGFYVRGGNIDQNLVLQDGAQVFNASHILGFFSVFNPDIIKKVTLYKGNIPARYGGRTASVLEAEIREASFDKFKIQGGVGLVISNLAAEIPVVKDKTSLLLAGRISYSDWLLNVFRDYNIRNSSASFNDLNIKLSQRVAGEGLISAGYYRSFDNFQYSTEFGYSWGNRTFSLEWRQPLSDQFSFQVSGSSSSNDNRFYEPEGIFAFELTNGISNKTAKAQVLYQLNSDLNLIGGAELNHYEMAPEKKNPLGAGSVVTPEVIAKNQGLETGYFLETEWEPGVFFAVNAGLRYSRYLQLGPTGVYAYLPGQPKQESTITELIFYQPGEKISHYDGLEPRFSCRFLIDDNQSFKIAYNRLYQYLHLISNSASHTPVDVWQVSTEHIPPQRSDNFSVGFFKTIRQQKWETSLEVYYRLMDNLLDYKDLPELLLNDHIETELIIGDGKSYGFEMSVKKKKGVLTGNVSYTYSRTFIKSTGTDLSEIVNNGDYYPSYFDQPHQFKGNFSYKIGKTHQVGVNFVYNSGRPITAPVGSYLLSGNLIPHFSERNQYRIPDYHRLDISYTFNRRIVRKSGYKDSFTFSIYNVLGRKNTFSIFFKSSASDDIYKAYRLAVLGSALPSMSYNFYF